MIRRVLDRLRGHPGEPSAPPLRPNELRREVVQAERRRREALAAAVASPRMGEEERPPRERAVTPPVAQVLDQAAFPSILKTRVGLRQAWLMKEILDAPVGMRGRDRGR